MSHKYNICLATELERSRGKTKITPHHLSGENARALFVSEYVDVPFVEVFVSKYIEHADVDTDCTSPRHIHAVLPPVRAR